jgi:hypothetical protein
VAQDPSVLLKRVAFDFPRDINHVRQLLADGFKILHLWDGKIVFRYDTPEEMLEHLLKSGAGTAYYDAVDPARRKGLEQQFLKTIKHSCEVVHDYICCIAARSRAKGIRSILQDG